MLAGEPALAGHDHRRIGDGGLHLEELAALNHTQTGAPRMHFRTAKRAAKSAFAQWLRSATGQTLIPTRSSDSQVKRIHEYNDSSSNALRVIVL